MISAPARPTRRAGPAAGAVTLAVALTALPGCGTILARTGVVEAGLAFYPICGVGVDLLGCIFILPIPLCLADLPLSLVADLVMMEVDASRIVELPNEPPPPPVDHGPVSSMDEALDRSLEDPSLGIRARRDEQVVDPASPPPGVAELSRRRRLVAASGLREGPTTAPRGAAIGPSGEAFVGVERDLTELAPVDPEGTASPPLSVRPGSKSVGAVACGAGRGIVLGRPGHAWSFEREPSAATPEDRWVWRPLAGAPRDGVVALGSCGDRAAAGGSQGWVSVWDLPPPLESSAHRGWWVPTPTAWRLESWRDAPITALAFDGCGALLAGNQDGELLRWTLEAPGVASVESLGRDGGSILAIAVGRDGAVLTAGSAGLLRVRRPGAEPTLLGVPELARNMAIVALTLGRDGRSVWVGAVDGVARELDLATGAELDRVDLRPLDDAPLAIAAPEDGALVVVTRRGTLLRFAAPGR